MSNAKLKVIEGNEQTKKVLADRPIKEIVGREAKTSHLTPPYFPDESKREPELSPFKLRMRELFKGKTA